MWLCWVFVAACRLSLITVAGATLLWCSGFSLQRLVLLRSTGCGARTSLVAACGLSSCGSWALGRRGSVVWLTGLVAPWHVGSSWTRDQTCVFLIGKQTLNHWTTREIMELIYYIHNLCVARLPCWFFLKLKFKEIL